MEEEVESENKEDGTPKTGLLSSWNPADILVGMLVVIIGIALLGALFIPEKREAIQEGRAKEYVGILAAIVAIITAHISRRGGKD